MERLKRVKKWFNENVVSTNDETSTAEATTRDDTAAEAKEAKEAKEAASNWRSEGLNDRERSFVEERMDPDFGLLDKLLASNALTRREMNFIRNQTTFEMRNAQLIDYIATATGGGGGAEKGLFGDLANALIDTHQSHLVNYLDSRGVYESSFGCDWPLTDRETKILDSNQEFLVDKLETTDLVGRLLARHVINGRQREQLAAKQTTYEKGETLLDILRRGSLTNYRKMIDCLHETNQSHIAQVLHRGGVVVPVHCTVLPGEEEEEEAKKDVVSELEEEVVDRITHLLASRSPADSSRIWELVQLRLFGAGVGRSVLLFFHCQTLSDLDELQLSYASGDLRLKVEAVFHRLLFRRIGVSLSAPSGDDYDELRNHFLSQTATETIPCQPFVDPSITSLSSDEVKDCACSESDRKSMTTGSTNGLNITGMNDLPFELLEMILEKFCLLSLTTSRPPSSCSTKDVFLRLASVESVWFTVIRRSKFQRTLMRHLSSQHHLLSFSSL